MGPHGNVFLFSIFRINILTEVCHAEEREAQAGAQSTDACPCVISLLCWQEGGVWHVEEDLPQQARQGQHHELKAECCPHRPKEQIGMNTKEPRKRAPRDGQCAGPVSGFSSWQEAVGEGVGGSVS